jgi:transcriptional regulator with XRE-family HTH domain
VDLDYSAAKKRLGRRVRQLRQRLGISQEGLALDAGVDRTFVSKIERGLGNPSLEILLKLSSVLSVKPKDLLD